MWNNMRSAICARVLVNEYLELDLQNVQLTVSRSYNRGEQFDCPCPPIVRIVTIDELSEGAIRMGFAIRLLASISSDVVEVLKLRTNSEDVFSTSAQSLACFCSALIVLFEKGIELSSRGSIGLLQ